MHININGFNNARERVYKVTCRKCESRLSYTYEDIKLGYTGFLQQLFNYKDVVYIVCPICKKELFLYEEKLMLIMKKEEEK